MASQEDVRRIALSLPETLEDESRFAFSVLNRGKQKGFAWVWLERVHPKKGRVPNPDVLAVRVRDIQEKEMYLASNPAIYFTEPHYNGFPAVLVRLAAIDADELKDLIFNAWRCQAPPELVKRLDNPHQPPPGSGV
jgi:hypothetical protein